jgi:hypothetical protein
MKKIALLCGLAVLAACSEAETTTEAEPMEAAAEAPAASWALEAGTYEYTRSDGVSGVNTVAADGTFSNAVSGGEIETGTWGQEGDLSCLTPAGGDQRCYTFTPPDAEGNLTGTREDGVTVTVRKVA